VESPSSHELRAALLVARIIDEPGNSADDARKSYRYVLSQGEHRTRDLHIGEALLIRVGLLTQIEDRLIPNVGLPTIARVDDITALIILESMTRAGDTGIDSRVDTIDRAEIGALGEEAVVRECRAELRLLGRPDLCQAVQRVSLADDRLGYDVSSPRIAGRPQMIEVKTMSARPRGGVTFYISRNEYEVGRRWPSDWSLVTCALGADHTKADVVGWCRASSLQPYLPEDRNGRWTEALVKLPMASLISGLPSAV
jgi:uncharacterized protein DUF3883